MTYTRDVLSFDRISDAEAKFLAWAPLVIGNLYTNSPNSPTTPRVTCFLNKLMKPGTRSAWLNKDRVQRIFSNNWHDFDTNGYVDYLRRDVIHAAKWSNNLSEFQERIIRLDNAILNGFAAISRVYGLWGDANLAARRMNDWAMSLQRNPRSVLSCYRP